jgi:CheY-like chemotaxis protein
MGYVLVVDDHPDVRKLVCDVLDVMGIEAREAKDGQEALEKVREARPDLIVLDLMMPVMDGFTTLTRLRAETDGDLIPVILLSAIAEEGNSMMKLPGVKGVLRKGGFTVSELRKMMTSIIEADKKDA